MTWLTTRPAEGCVADQRFARRGPTVRMGVAGGIVFQEARQLGVKFGPTGQAPTGQKAALQDTKEACGLLEPGAVCGGAMPHVPVCWLTQKRPAFSLPWQLRGLTGHLAPPGHEAADLQAPGGVEIVHEPIVALHPRYALGDVLEMGDTVRTLPGGPDGPSALPGGHDQRVDQYAGAVAYVCIRASFTFAGLGRCGRGGALKDLHARLCIAAEHQAALVIRLQGLDVELAQVVGFRRARLVVALEPIRTFVRRQIDRVEEAPNGRAADGLGLPVAQQGGHDLIERPPCDRAPLLLRHLAGDSDDRHAGARGHGARSPRAGGILEARKAEGGIPSSPRTHGAIGAVEVTTDLYVSGGIRLRRSQDNPSA
jgi:hypothetical protein